VVSVVAHGPLDLHVHVIYYIQIFGLFICIHSFLLQEDIVKMALNKFMHPKNPYKEKPPDFKNLALKYPEFAKCIFQDLKGKIHLDYKSAASLRQLAIALLKEDFDLDVEMPLNRLIPTIPLRLNYILWIEDILKESSDVKLKGIDIGMFTYRTSMCTYIMSFVTVSLGFSEYCTSWVIIEVIKIKSTIV
jgi:methyltransferase